MMKTHFIIGTRGSRLALWQAKWVQSALIKNNPSARVDLEVIKTKGDKILDVPLARVGGKGLFVKEIEEALLNHDIDIAVHSMKDMPALLPDGLCMGGIPKRETTCDILISRTNCTLRALQSGAKVGTSSLRRSSQLRHARPDLEIVPLRGNLDTRIRKLDSGELDGIILAAAGVKRLEYEDRISEYIDISTMVPAVGQGALCVETRENDIEVKDLVSCLDHRETRLAVQGERGFLTRLEGGCQVPIGALAAINGKTISITGMVADLNGGKMIRETLSGPAAAPEKTGIILAEKLLELGAGEILDKLKSDERDVDEG